MGREVLAERKIEQEERHIVPIGMSEAAGSAANGRGQAQHVKVERRMSEA